MNSEKYNELVLCFNETLMYGFVGLLPKNYPEELSLGGVSYYHRDMAWLKHVMKHTFFMPRGLVEDDPTYK